MRVSYLEIYIEEVRDILSKNPQKKLEVRERPDIGVYVKDISSFVVKNAADMEKLMSIGTKNSESRPYWPLTGLLISSPLTPPGMTAFTAMNHESSRSHVIFTITVERSDLGPDKQQHVRMGKLHLVDLAVRTTPPPPTPQYMHIHF